MRRIKNGLGRAIVLLERDNLSGRPVALKVEDVADVCAAPAIDGLVVVTHHAEIAVFGGEFAYPGVLDAVGVLVLINVQVLPLRSVAIRNGGRLLQKAQPLEEQVIKVEGFKSLELSGVTPRKSSDEALVVRDRAILHLICAEAIVLRAANRAKNEARLRLPRRWQVVLFQEPLDHARLIVGVVDGEALRESNRLTVAAEHAGAEAVEGAHRHVARRLADHFVKAIPHLGGGLVGEGHGKDLPRCDPLVLDEPGDSVGNHPRLP